MTLPRSARAKLGVMGGGTLDVEEMSDGLLILPLPPKP
jgi:hypothetical protein